jgi:hypothetical protein
MSAWIRFETRIGISQVYCQVCDLVLTVLCCHSMIVPEHRQQASAASLPDCFAPWFVSDLLTVWPSGSESLAHLDIHDLHVRCRSQVQSRRVLLHSQNHHALSILRSDFAGQVMVWVGASRRNFLQVLVYLSQVESRSQLPRPDDLGGLVNPPSCPGSQTTQNCSRI